jgi:arylsulfatase A-like enzyme
MLNTRASSWRMLPLLAFLLAPLVTGPVAGGAGEPAAGKAPAGKPNVLLLVADDLGYGEMGFQGNKEIPTPNLDALAKGGVRFTAGYVSGPYCSPTRAGLLTGRYQTRFGHELNPPPNSQHGLPLTERTMADRLKELGYATCAVGKWHLGEAPEMRPTKRGFDEFYGTLANTPFFHPTRFIDSRLSNDVRPVPQNDFYTTDAYAERAVDWMGKNKDKPWFLYLPFNAQHAPLQATQKYLDRFAGIQDPKRRTFAAMLSAMDDAVGRVVGKVREMGQEENTLIFFFTDNGGPTRSTTSKNDPLRGFKSTTWEGGVRVPFLMQWKGKLPAGKVYEHPVIQLDILPTCLAAAGQNVDPAWKLDGVDLVPYLTGANSGKPHETLYWRFAKQWAVRHGDWKLIVGNGGSGKPELYDLSKDISESKDQAAEQPEKVKELQAVYDEWNKQQAAPLWARPAQTGAAPEGAAPRRRQRRNRTPAPPPPAQQQP